MKAILVLAQLLAVALGLPAWMGVGNLVDRLAAIAGSEGEQSNRNEIRVLVTGDDTEPVLVRESQKLALRHAGVHFMDVTGHTDWWFSQKKKAGEDVPVYHYPAQLARQKTVRPLLEHIDKHEMHRNLANLTSFFSRYYKSETGLQSADWLFSRIQDYVDQFNTHKLDVTLSKFKHDWLQYSIVVSIAGHSSKNTVIVGCHQDSTNLLFPTLMKAPGADDDGSGVTSNLEALRLFLLSGVRPANTVEFHFYSAEEGGLLGSLDVFRAYKTSGRVVLGMLQQDMTGYVQKSLDNGVQEHIGLITDYVSPNLVQFLKLIIDEYLSVPYKETQCGYACSDHASALQNGFPSAFVIESDFKLTNPYIHSTSDTLDRLSFDHMAEFTKLALAYAIELQDLKVSLSGE